MQQGLFGNYKYCNFCGKPLPIDYEEDYCPLCKEHQLFREVKEYIRENDVNEYDVALRFNIPIFKIKEWIREGRIEYKKNSANEHRISSHCKECGEPIAFGTVCSKCLKKRNVSGHGKIESGENGHMRYFDDDMDK